MLLPREEGMLAGVVGDSVCDHSSCMTRCPASLQRGGWEVGGEVVKTLFHSDSKIYWFLRILHFTVFCLFQLMQLESEPGKFMMAFWINTSLLRSTSFMQWPKKGEKTRLGISAAEQGTINMLWRWSLVLLQGDPAVWDSKKRSQNMPQPTSNIFNCKQKFWAGTALQ